MPIFPAQPPQKHPLSCTITPPESSLSTPEESDHIVILWSGSPQPHDLYFCSPKSQNISKVLYMVQRSQREQNGRYRIWVYKDRMRP